MVLVYSSSGSQTYQLNQNGGGGQNPNHTYLIPVIDEKTGVDVWCLVLTHSPSYSDICEAKSGRILVLALDIVMKLRCI